MREEKSAQSRAGRQKRRERLLDAADARLLMLHILAQRSAHGYELIKAIEEMAGGEYAPSPSLIYPNLTLLEEMGQIAPAPDGSDKKAWQLTTAGHDALAEQQEKLTTVTARLETLAVLVANRDIPAISEAIHLMKSTLHQRLAQADLSPATLAKIVSALEKAAKEIAAS